MILNMESFLIIQNQMKIWESGFCFAFWKCFPRLGNWDWSGRMHSTGNQEWLGNLPGTSCEALGSHSAPCLTAALRKMMLSACRGWEAVEQQDKILVFLELLLCGTAVWWFCRHLTSPYLRKYQELFLASPVVLKQTNKKTFTIVSKYIHIDVCKIV